jgi:hypothetical protein
VKPKGHLSKRKRGRKAAAAVAEGVDSVVDVDSAIDAILDQEAAKEAV